MVNFKKLADRARDVVEQQGGTDALKEKAQRMKEAASAPGSASDKAKAAAQIAREKPNQASPTAGDDMTGGPIGGGTAPPTPTPAPEANPAPAAPVEPIKTPPAPEPEDATPSESDELSSSARGSKDK